MTQIDGRLLVGLLVALLAVPGCHDDSTQVTPGIAPDADASGGEDVGPDVADGETDSGVDVDDDTSGCLTAEDCPQPDDACGLAMCGADGSCSMAPRPDGEFCDDGDTCTAGETCQSGACSGGVDVCADCAESPDGAPCDDGDACTQGETCLSGACAGGDTVTCSASAPCQSALCDPVEGCVEVASDDGQVCSDGNACTSGDQCVSGVCEGGDNTCDCSSDDDCAPFAGPCAAALTCASGQCVVSDEPETCPQPADPCLQAVCDAVAGGCVAVAVADGTPCESGVPCADGICTDGSCQAPVDPCDDGDVCTDDECNDGACTHTGVAGVACDDGNPCTDGDTCDANGACAPGVGVCVCASPADCVDTDPCFDTWSCIDNQCVPELATDCSLIDGPCVVGSCDAAGVCQAVAVDDGTACTDGNPCTTAGACQAGSCLSQPQDCDDSNPCTDDTCDAATGGCVNTPNNAPCDDGNACTSGDICADGTCGATGSLDCGTDVPCLVGSCDPQQGCVTEAAPDQTPCDDGDDCTDQDACSAGACQGSQVCECAVDADCPDDGDLCNGVPVCNADFECELDPTTVVTCQAGGQCALSVCAPDTGQCECNDPPSCIGDAGAATQDVVLTVPAPGVLGNDSDPDGDLVSVTSFDGTSTQGATVTVAADGGYSYNPRTAMALIALPEGEMLADTFNYTVSAVGGTSTCAVTITVTGVNDAPTAVDDTGTTNEDTPLSVTAPGVLANDTDSDTGDTRTVSQVNGSAANVGVLVTLASGAQVTVQADGSYVYNPTPGHNDLSNGASATDAFTYVVGDANGLMGTGTVNLTVTGLNDPITAIDDTINTDDDKVATGSVVANDTDPDTGDPRTVTQVNGNAANVGVEQTLASGATVTVQADGTYTYDPTPGHNDLAPGENANESFTYQVSDGTTQSTGTANIAITGTNGAPSAVADTGTTDEDTVLNVAAPGLLGNDTDPENQMLSVGTVNGDVANVGVQQTLPSGAFITINADGSYTYDPRPGHSGLAEGASAMDVIAYTASDGLGSNSDSVNLTLTITGANDAPTGVADTYTNVVGNTRFQVHNMPTLPAHFAGDVLDNDTDPEGQTLSVVAETKATAQAGSVTIDTSGQFTYTPAVGFVGNDTFTYTLNDPQSASSTATVTLSVSNLVWYVDADGPAGDGRDSTPFNSLSAADAATPAADTIVSVVGAASGDITLGSRQQLLGAGVALMVNTFTLRTTSATNAIDSTVTLGTDNTINGLAINRTAAAGQQAGLVGNGFGTLTAPGLSITAGNGAPLNLNNGTLAATTRFDTLTCPASTSGGVILNQITGTFTASMLNLTTTGGTGFQATTVGALAVSGGSVNATGGRALDLNATTGSLTLDAVSSTNSSAEGVRIVGLTGTTAFALASTQITQPTNTGVLVQNCGNRTFSFGDTDVTGAGVSGGAVGAGVDVSTGNSGATFNFTDLDVTTDNGGGVLAADCRIDVAGTGATVAALRGPALDLNGTSGDPTTGFTWASLQASNSTTTGLDLNNLGTNFTVTGTTTVVGAATAGLKVTNVVVGRTVAFTGAVSVNAAGGAVGVMVGSNTTSSAGSVTFDSVTVGGTTAQGFYVRDTKVVTVTGTLTLNAPLGGVGALLDQNISAGGGTTTIGTLTASTGRFDALTSTAQAGTVAINGGTVTVGNARAVDLANCTLNVTLNSVSSTAASVNTVRLQNTTGTFTIAGGGGTTQGGDASGGTIANAANVPAVLLNNAAGVTLRNVTFAAPAAGAIDATNLRGTSEFAYSRVTNATGSAATANFVQSSGAGTITLNGLLMTGSDSTNAHDTRFVVQGAGTTATLTVQGSAFTDSQPLPVQVASTMGASATVTVGGAEAPEGNVFAAAPAGASGGVRLVSSATMNTTVRHNTFTGMRGTQVQITSEPGATSLSAMVQDNTLSSLVGVADGILVSANHGDHPTLTLQDNTCDGPMERAIGVVFGDAATGTANVRITGNSIGTNIPVTSNSDVLTLSQAQGGATVSKTITAMISNNAIVTGTSGLVMNLVRVEGRTSGSPVTWNVSVSTNTLTDGTGNALELLRIRARDPGVTLCTNVAGNTFSGVSTHIRLREDTGAALTVQGPTTNTVTPVDMTTANNGATAVITGTPTFTNGASCPTP